MTPGSHASHEGDASAAPEPMSLLRALSDDDRLRIVGLLALRPRDAADLALLLGITEASLEHHLKILRGAGLVRRKGAALALDTRPLRAVMAAASPPPEPSPMIPPDAPDEIRRILGSFFEGERLTKIPSSRRKLLVVLARLADLFEPGRWYPEKEVNRMLAEHHPDVAALRRGMVDEGLVERHRGRYRRAGGSDGR